MVNNSFQKRVTSTLDFCKIEQSCTAEDDGKGEAVHNSVRKMDVLYARWRFAHAVAGILKQICSIPCAMAHQNGGWQKLGGCRRLSCESIELKIVQIDMVLLIRLKNFVTIIFKICALLFI